MSNSQDKSFDGERTPAQQAEEMTEKVQASMNLATGKAKYIWSSFSKPEKIIAIGAGVGLLAFFLPWVSGGGVYISGFKVGSQNAYAYLLPLLMVASLVLLYFTQGASGSRKTLAARWQIAIGSIGATIGLLEQFMGTFGGLFRGASFGASAGIGAYLFAAGAISIVVGAFKLQAMLIRHQPRQ